MPREGQYIPVDFSKRARFAHFSTPTLRNCFWKSISNSSSDFGNKFDQEVAAAAEVTAVATAAKQRARILEMQAGQMMS